MRTPLQYVNEEPFPLRSNVIFFHDWRHVCHGYPQWRTASGERPPLFGSGPLPEIHFRRDSPYGLRLKVIPARKTEIALRQEMPWEGIIGSVSVVREGGVYRMWYEVVTPEMMASPHAGLGNLLCYAESDDGMHWRRPLTGGTNAVYGGELAGEWGYHGGSVFLDEDGPAEGRYKAVYLAQVPETAAREFAAKHPQSVADWPRIGERNSAIAAATSPDGLAWTRNPQPLCLHFSDTQNIAGYNSLLKQYVGYCRTWVLGRRSVGCWQSEAFAIASAPETILWPSADVGPIDTWYGNAYNTWPGAPEYHLLFPHRWQIADDRFYVHLFTSPDGILWGAPPRNQVLTPGERGEWDTGGVVFGRGMVDLPGNRVGIPYVGFSIPHKYPRRPPLGQVAWATWEQDRLVALEAPEDAECSTWIFDVQGSALRLNARTKYSGWIKVGLLGADREPIPGYTLDDCDPVDGNHFDQPVSWHGNAQLPPGPLGFMVRMRHAELFSLRL
ncbi:MAG: hypothetical protein ACYDCO_27040 [Armatimonadota bacterium]